jgi:cytochrome P450
VTEVFFNPFDPDFRRNPYTQYDALRENDPVHRSPVGAVVLTRYADVQAVLRSPHAGMGGTMDESGREQVLRAQGIWEWWQDSLVRIYMGTFMLTIDPPDHTRIRGLVSKAFTPKAIEAMRPRIQAIVDELVDEVEARDTGSAEIVEDLAFPLPALVICEMLGVPPSDRDYLKQWSHDAARLIDPMTDPELMKKADEALRGFTEYFSGLVADRRKHPRDDLLTAMAQAEEEGDRLSDHELNANAIFLFVAGHETTTNLIGNAIYNLLRSRDQLDRLCADPSLAVGATEETLRFESPIQMTGRGVAEDITLPDGTAIAEGERTILLLAAANRDPAQFPDPARYDIGRGETRPLAFGGGVHYCLGAALARVEGQVALGTIARRWSNLELASDEPRWKETFTLRGLEDLPIAFSPARS